MIDIFLTRKYKQVSALHMPDKCKLIIKIISEKENANNNRYKNYFLKLLSKKVVSECKVHVLMSRDLICSLGRNIFFCKNRRLWERCQSSPRHHRRKKSRKKRL